jgi:RNA polymerase sigma-70 factor (ECF subfamily)
MSRPELNSGSIGQKASWFTTTHWSVVLNAAHSSSPAAQAALETLCRTYWYPLYAYVRRKGRSTEDAQDLTQEFFARLIKDKLVSQFHGEGKFRSFLLASLEHFLAKEWNRAHRQKREGGHTVISLDADEAEHRFGLEPVGDVTAEALYDRRWALTVLEQALSKLGEEYRSAGNAELFDQLKGLLSGDRTDAPYADVAAGLHMSEDAVKVAAHRLRRRYGEAVRVVIAETVARPDELEDELRHLFAVLRQGKVL